MSDAASRGHLDLNALLPAALLGLGGGLRSMAPTAVLAARGAGLFPGPARFIAFGAAAGELIADKQPDMGRRTAPRGLTLRVGSSAAGGRELAGTEGAIVAAAVAAATAWGASRLRTKAPGLATAVAEDAVSYATIAWATRRVGSGGPGRTLRGLARGSGPAPATTVTGRAGRGRLDRSPNGDRPSPPRPPLRPPEVPMSTILRQPLPVSDPAPRPLPVAEPPATATAPRPTWRADLAPYTVPSTARGVAGLLTSVVPYLALSTAMASLVPVSYWLVLLLAIPTAGFAVRTYIVFHDCAHGSFLPSRRANHVVGVVTSLMVFTPFAAWKHHHAVHHATAGDLDRRGEGDVHTLTVDEYRALPRAGRLKYRFGRNPLVMLTLGPIWELLIQTRIWKRTDRTRIKRSVIGTNVALLVIVAVLCVVMGPVRFLLVQVPITWLAGAAGIWLFYVQHQYEDAYWENSDSWDYAEAALQGSSFLKLPRVLRFFSGNIGLHHVHHLSAKVPNYRLQAAHDATPILRDVPVLTLWDGVRALRLKLWDPGQGRLVTWRQAAAPGAAGPRWARVTRRRRSAAAAARSRTSAERRRPAENRRRARRPRRRPGSARSS